MQTEKKRHKEKDRLRKLTSSLSDKDDDDNYQHDNS